MHIIQQAVTRGNRSYILSPAPAPKVHDGRRLFPLSKTKSKLRLSLTEGRKQWAKWPSLRTRLGLGKRCITHEAAQKGLPSKKKSTTGTPHPSSQKLKLKLKLKLKQDGRAMPPPTQTTNNILRIKNIDQSINPSTHRPSLRPSNTHPSCSSHFLLCFLFFIYLSPLATPLSIHLFFFVRYTIFVLFYFFSLPLFPSLSLVFPSLSPAFPRWTRGRVRVGSKGATRTPVAFLLQEKSASQKRRSQ